MSRNSQLLRLLVISFAVFTLPTANAAPVFTQTVIAGDADILNDGTLIEANNVGSGSSATTVNGVSFGDGSGASLTNLIDGGGDFSSDPFSTELDTILSSLVFAPSTAVSALNLSGLTIGTDYRLQLLFSNDVNGTGQNQSIRLDGVTHGLGSWLPNAINLTIDFTATSAAMSAELLTSGGNRTVLNGYALHDLSENVPAPAALGTLLLGLGLMLQRARRER